MVAESARKREVDVTITLRYHVHPDGRRWVSADDVVAAAMEVEDGLRTMRRVDAADALARFAAAFRPDPEEPHA